MNIVRRGLTRQQAAKDIFGLKLSTFDKYRKLGIIPGPTLPGGRYDSQLMQATADRMSGISAAAAPLSPLEQWRASRARSS